MEKMIQLENLLAREHLHFDELNETQATKNLREVRVALQDHVCKVTSGGDLALIVATEKAIVRGDLIRYANSQAMVSSLNGALEEIDATERLLVKVSDPAHYHEVDQSFSVSKHRKGGLPIDEARQAFRSHITRLRNMDKSRLTDEEKKLIDARKSAMSTAEKLYIALQKQALGISPENNSVPPVPALPTSVLRMFLAKRDVEQVGDAAGLPKEVQQTLATNVTAHDAAMRKNEGRYFDLFWKEQFGVGREDARKRLAAHEGCFERVESYHKGLIVLLREQLVRPKEGMDSVVRRHAKSYSDVLLKTFQSMNPTIPFKEFHGRYMEPADLGRQKPQVSPTPASSSKPQPPRDNNTPTPSLGCSV